MSKKAVDWANGIRCLSHQKSILLAMAENYRDEDDVCGPISHRTLAHLSGLSMNISRNAVKRLVAVGIITIIDDSTHDIGAEYRIVWGAKL